MTPLQLQPITDKDLAWVKATLERSWGSTEVVSRGRLHRADRLPGIIALDEGKRVGLATYRVAGGECEIVTLNSEIKGIGIGAALVEQIKAIAAAAGCRRLWVITTNDNLAAIRFYQKRGFTLVAVHRNALVESRRLKPGIPLFGLDGLPLRDEIEFGYSL